MKPADLRDRHDAALAGRSDRARHRCVLVEQHDAWASVFGPVGADGYYKPLYDKASGAIDPEVANFWRNNYDLR